jgi:ribosomal protein RSM22 (predicted rRNA methylase)
VNLTSYITSWLCLRASFASCLLRKRFSCVFTFPTFSLTYPIPCHRAFSTAAGKLDPELFKLNVKKAMKSFTKTVPGDWAMSEDSSQIVNTILKENDFRPHLNHIFLEKNYAVWHLANRTPPIYFVLVRVLNELRKRLPALQVESVLDFGSGAGERMLAVSAVWPEAQAQCVAVENNLDLSSVARKLLSQTQLSVVYRPRLTEKDATQRTLVVAGYSLSSVAPEKRRATLDFLWQSTSTALVRG